MRPLTAFTRPGMRVNLKLLMTGVVVLGLLMSVSLWSKCTDGTKHDDNFFRDSSYVEKFDPGGLAQSPVGHHLQASNNNDHKAQEILEYQALDCRVNGEYTIPCRREGDEVYVPFTFLHKYFEVYGHIIDKDGAQAFDWQHSYSQVYTPHAKYSTRGVFMSFDHYNVEVRDRVKCISGKDGVPVSTQWNSQGHLYPIQIAQFGLSHYSKHLTAPAAKTVTLEDGLRRLAKWAPSSAATTVPDASGAGVAMRFDTIDSMSGAGLRTRIGVTDKAIVTLDYRFHSNASLSFHVETKNALEFHLHYVCSSGLISAANGHIYHGLGPVSRHGSWRHLTRNLNIDLAKGMMLMGYKLKELKTNIKIVKIHELTLRGRGDIDNLLLQDQSHLSHFFDAADWLVANQDAQGGWPVQVERRLAGGKLSLESGWYSAMAQGQAMSVLARAYLSTRKPLYLRSALAATQLFKVPSQDGGVLATFMDRYPWYEEYPTSPSSFVLNGFIYSLLGLYDLKSVANADDRTDAEQLYDNGMASLKALLPLYDSGSGSIYDLRHVTLGVAPNLARWDYHTTHINQLLLLGTLDADHILNSTAHRWSGYMKGERAQHN